jgi:prophage maintenance system killer protein
MKARIRTPRRTTRRQCCFEASRRATPSLDANKRTGFLLAVYYLDRMGYVLRSDLTPAVVSFSRRVSAGKVRDLENIAAALAEWTEPRREPLG